MILKGIAYQLIPYQSHYQLIMEGNVIAAFPLTPEGSANANLLAWAISEQREAMDIASAEIDRVRMEQGHGTSFT